MVPDGWRSEKIGKLCKSIVPGRNKPKSFDGDVPWVTTPDLTKKYIPQPSHELHVSKEELSKAGGKTIPSGSVVISCVGELGLTAINTREVVINQQLHAFVCPESLMAEYVYYFIQTRKSELYSLASTTTIPYLNKSNCESITLSFPRLSEQREIVDILSTWDLAIETTEKLIVNSRAQKKALMQQLLTGKKRLPGFDGEWKSTKLSELGVISSAGVDKKIVESEPPVRLLNFLDAYNREFIWSTDLTQKVTAPPAKVAQCDVQRGDVFFTPSSETRNDIGLAAVAAENMPGVVYSYHVVRLRPSLPLDLNFSAYVFQTDHFRRQTYRAGDGSGQRYVISQNLFRAMDVMLPPLEEQSAIGEVLLSCSKQIAELETDLEALKVEKAALMQQLLTGKRRVTIEEAAA